MKFFQSFLLASAPLVSGSLLYADLLAQVESRLQKRLVVGSLDTPIDVTGDHAFVAPDFDSGDQRGPCPGLNALANHGYIPHNGVTSFVDVVVAMNSVYGMGIDTSLILALMGTVWTGNPLSLDPGFSIGGYTDDVENLLGNLGGLLGTPRGLVGSHNFIESDSSNTREDLYLTGDAHHLNMSMFNEFYSMSNSTEGDYSFDIMGLRASKRWFESVTQNPNFYYGPLSGLIARNAGFAFPRLFRNHSTENPEGTLTKDILKSFFAISGEEGNFTYNEGHESIPDNWYRKPVDYFLADLLLDLVNWARTYPEILNIGGNTGTVNSFTGLDLSNVTSGVYNIDTLLEGNNLLCFAFEVVKFVAPGSLSSIFETIDVPLQLLTDALAQPILDLDCPALDDLEVGGENFFTGVQDLYPGAGAGL